jgi:hypothetical protein
LEELILFKPNSTFLDHTKYEEYCKVYEDYDEFITIIIVIPCTYLLVALAIVCYCLKYRKISSQYQRLRDEKDLNENLASRPNNNIQQLEMSEAKNKNQ